MTNEQKDLIYKALVNYMDKIRDDIEDFKEYCIADINNNDWEEAKSDIEQLKILSNKLNDIHDITAKLDNDWINEVMNK